MSVNFLRISDRAARLLGYFCMSWPRFNSWHVPFRDSYYKGEPGHAAATHHVFVYYMLMIWGYVCTSPTCAWAWLVLALPDASILAACVPCWRLPMCHHVLSVVSLVPKFLYQFICQQTCHSSFLPITLKVVVITISPIMPISLPCSANPFLAETTGTSANVTCSSWISLLCTSCFDFS